MNCPICGTPGKGGASKCSRCGAAITAGSASSSSDELELKPLEPSKAPAHSPFEPPPDLVPSAEAPNSQVAASDPARETGPARYMYRPRGANAAPARNSQTKLIIGGAVALVLVLFIGWRMFRTENKVVIGKSKVDQTTWTLQPNQPKIENLEISGKISYTLELTSLDSGILIGMVQRAPRDSGRVADLKKLPDPLETLGKGQSRTLSGDLKAGQYSWVLINEGKKAARVKVKFATQ